METNKIPEGVIRVHPIKENKLPSLNRRLVFFDYAPSMDGKAGDDWLQITAVTGIGAIDDSVKQKIIRLDREDQEKLFKLMAERLGQK